MLTRAIPTSPSSSHDKVGRISQSILIRCEMQRLQVSWTLQGLLISRLRR